MTVSIASTQLAAFHQPVVFHRPLELYQDCRVEAAVAALALKSSPATTAARACAEIRHSRIKTKPRQREVKPPSQTVSSSLSGSGLLNMGVCGQIRSLSHRCQ